MKIAEKILQVLCALASAVSLLASGRFIVLNLQLSQKGQMTISEAAQGYAGMLEHAKDVSTWAIVALVLSVFAAAAAAVDKSGGLGLPIGRTIALLVSVIIDRTQVINVLDNISLTSQEAAQQAGNQIGTGISIVLLLLIASIAVSVIVLIKNHHTEEY